MRTKILTSTLILFFATPAWADAAPSQVTEQTGLGAGVLLPAAVTLFTTRAGPSPPAG